MPVRLILAWMFWMLATGAIAVASAATAGQADPRYLLRLYEHSFDPLVELPPILRDTKQSQDANWHLVQLQGPSRQAWLQKLATSGLQPVQYLHPYTYIVWASREQIEAVSALDFVRWTGPFVPVLRLDDAASDGDTNGMLQVLVLSARTEQGLVEQALTRSSAIIRAINNVNNYLQVIYLSLPNIRSPELLDIPGVYAAQVVAEEPHTRGEAQAQLIVGGVDEQGRPRPGYLDWLQHSGYDGSGITIAVVDQFGVRSSHLDLFDRVRSCLPADDEVFFCSEQTEVGDHATHVVGAIVGTGRSGQIDAAGFLRGLGVAPGATVLPQQYNYRLEDGNLVPGGILAIFRESAANGAVIANNSWGLATKARGYDIPTMQVDMVARNADPTASKPHPILPVWAIMNGAGEGAAACAPGSLGAPDEAKNLLAVGATDLLDTSGVIHTANLSSLASRSGHGNACDGRRVPHLVAPGCSTDNTTAGSDSSHDHRGFCGTSMAAPNVSGAAAIVMQRHLHRHGRLPSPALVKAMLTATAIDLAGHSNADRSAVMGHRPDRFQGYGRLDLGAAVSPATQVLHFDQDHVFTDSEQSWLQSVYVDDPTQPVRIMLAWTDAPGHGLGGETPAWVNDLDLDVAGAGQRYLGNVIGPGGWSTAGGVPDRRNNLEGVFLSPEQHVGGRLELSVRAHNIAADALDPYQPDFSAPRQDFALVCYNCSALPSAAHNLLFRDGFEP